MSPVARWSPVSVARLAPELPALPIQRWEPLPQRPHLRHVVDNDVSRVQMPLGVVLLGRLGGLEGSQGRDLRHDGARVRVRRAQGIDVRSHDSALRVAVGEDDRPVARPDIGALPIQLRWVVRHGEEDVEELAKATIDSLRLLWRGRPAERIPPLKPGWNGAEL